MRHRAAIGLLIAVLAPPLAPAAAANTAAPAPAPAPGSASASTPVLAPAPAREARLPVRVAVQTEAAPGVGPGSFYNHLTGLRLDFGFSPRVSFGGYLGYANLKGKDGRAHDLLPYGQLEYLAGSFSSAVRIPLRFASGYLPRNGPVVRASAGLAFAVGSNVDLVTELLAPMIWVTGDQMLLSMNISLELAFRL